MEAEYVRADNEVPPPQMTMMTTRRAGGDQLDVVSLAKSEVYPPVPRGQTKAYFEKWGVSAAPPTGKRGLGSCACYRLPAACRHSLPFSPKCVSTVETHLGGIVAARTVAPAVVSADLHLGGGPGAIPGGEVAYASTELAPRSWSKAPAGRSGQLDSPLLPMSEVLPPPPRGQTKACFEEWGVPTTPPATRSSSSSSSLGREGRPTLGDLHIEISRGEVCFVPSEVHPLRVELEVCPPEGLLEQASKALANP